MLYARVKGALGLVARRLGLVRPRRLPRVSRVRVGSTTARFEVTTPTEAFRVEEYGGEEQFLRAMLEEMRRGDVLYDVGACVGMVAVNAALRGVRVIAFEPDPGFRERLHTNLRLNRIAGVQVEEWAVSDTAGDVTLFTDGVGGYSPSLRSARERDKVVVRSDAIDNAWRAGTIPGPDVVKLDIEGAEILALRGMRALCSSSSAPRTIFMEVHPNELPQFGASVEDLSALIAEMGYEVAERAERSHQLHYVCRKAGWAG